MAGAEVEEGVGCVVYKKDEDDSDNDAWDDTALIKAYDSAVTKMKEHITGKSQDQDKEESQMGNGDSAPDKKKKRNKKKKKSKKKTSWQVSDRCQAVYSQDGLVYQAVILSLDAEAGTCRVRYSGYGNEEEQKLSNLMRVDDRGRQRHPTSASETESMDTGAQRLLDSDVGASQPSGRQAHRAFSTPNFQPSSPYSFPFTNGHTGQKGMPMPPPPPPVVFEEGVASDNEALSSMLMAWYMSGYHTGFYQGMRQGRQQTAGASGGRLHHR